MAEQSDNLLGIDSANFDSEKYCDAILKECTLKEIVDAEAVIIKGTQALHSDMQTLVYENYNKFISATDTIRKMKKDFMAMESDMNLLKSKMDTVTKSSEEITTTLEGSRWQLSKLSKKYTLLKRLQFLSTLPGKLKYLIGERKYTQAVQYYLHAQKVFTQYGSQPSFAGIQCDCDLIITELKKELHNNFQIEENSTQALTEAGELLLQLGENANSLASELLISASKQLHEQIVILQDQTGRDMIEFVDMGIEGFLKNLNFIVTSYFEMFISKNDKQECRDLQESTDRIRKFLNENIDKYLSLIQDRVESDIEYGDTQIMLRGLDRLHRRLLIMRNMFQGTEIQRSTMDIIISAAQQRCKVHAKTLRDHFADSLSSIRLSLIPFQKNTSEKHNLNELITSLYVSTIEKVKGVLQDLLIFLQTSWSFNMKSEHKGVLCAEAIREDLLMGFLRHLSKVMNNFSEEPNSSPPSLFLILSKTCLEMEKNGIHILLSILNDMYEFDSLHSASWTEEVDICNDIHDTAQNLLNTYVRLQGKNISQMLRRSIETRDWINCIEPRSVRAVMKRVVEELTSIEKVVGSLYESEVHTTASSDSSRKTHYGNLNNSKHQYRSNWSNCTPSQLESNYITNIHRLFTEKLEIFTPADFSKTSIITGVIKIGLKTFLECVRLRVFSKFGLQQIQVDTHYLQINLWRFGTDENLVHFLLDEILGSAVHRCLESILMEPNAVEIICERD